MAPPDHVAKTECAWSILGTNLQTIRTQDLEHRETGIVRSTPRLCSTRAGACIGTHGVRTLLPTYQVPGIARAGRKTKQKSNRVAYQGSKLLEKMTFPFYRLLRGQTCLLEGKPKASSPTPLPPPPGASACSIFDRHPPRHVSDSER